jgi:two-component system response regulator GlrR
MSKPKIIIIGDMDAEPLGAEVHAIIERDNRYDVCLTAALSPNWTASDSRPDLIIPLLPAAKEEAAKILTILRASNADTPLLPVLRSENLNVMLDELSQSTTDFLLTPLRPIEVLTRVGRLVSWTKKEKSSTPGGRLVQTVELAQLIGEAPAFVAIKRKLPLVARHGAPVLLTGETGSGKELCARALHYLSPRAGKPFLPVNCGSIPAELFESELFGHQKGAFTGAWAAQTGLVEEAEGGTLFLDEIESLNLGAQVKLLRFIEDHSYHSLGSAKARQADVWIITATNVDLTGEIRQRTFREDLFYRLAVMNLNLPPLRQRRADIPLLVEHFWSRHAEPQEERERRLSPRAMEALCQYAWPGNIRELQNVIQQLLVLTDVQIVEPNDLPISLPVSLEPSPALSLNQARAKIIAQFEKSYITEALRANHGNVTHAAKTAKTDRRNFGRLMRKYQIGRFL